jgi:hypothetical protein
LEALLNERKWYKIEVCKIYFSLDEEDPNYPMLWSKTPTKVTISLKQGTLQLHISLILHLEGVRDWNDEFQKLREREVDNYYTASNNSELERISELRDLCEDFADVAKRIGYMLCYVHRKFSHMILNSNSFIRSSIESGL